MLSAAAQRVALASGRRTFEGRGVDIGIFRVPLSRSKNRLNPTALLEQPLFYCGLQLIEPIDMALAEAELRDFSVGPNRRRRTLKNWLGQPQFTTWVDDSLTIKTLPLHCKYE